MSKKFNKDIEDTTPVGEPRSLTDTEIISEKIDRRSFLSKTGLMATTLAVAGLTKGCLISSSDTCDFDTSDSDPFDPFGSGGDACDSD